MSKQQDYDDYELRDEYDLSSMTVVPKGRYAPGRRLGKNVALLATDVMQAFPTDDAVNEALRLVIRIARIPGTHTAAGAQSHCIRAFRLPSNRGAQIFRALNQMPLHSANHDSRICAGACGAAACGIGVDRDSRTCSKAKRLTRSFIAAIQWENDRRVEIVFHDLEIIETTRIRRSIRQLEVLPARNPVTVAGERVSMERDV